MIVYTEYREGARVEKAVAIARRVQRVEGVMAAGLWWAPGDARYVASNPGSERRIDSRSPPTRRMLDA